MNIPSLDERTKQLRRMMDAARHEADHAVAYREAWRPMAHDADLHQRMGASFASNTFLTIRVALWREMLAALMRIWDTRGDSINLAWMVSEVQKEDVCEKLFDENKLEPVTNLQIRRGMLDSTKLKVEKAVALLDLYKSGTGKTSLEFLRRIRHEQLAHRQNEALTKEPAGWNDEQIEKFVADTTKIVSLLLSIVANVSYNLNETANAYSHHALLFWASARGERTEGHPNYRPPPDLSGFKS